MKRFVFALLLLMGAAYVSAGEDRSQVLKVYDWADVIAEETVAGFPAFYKRYTGKDIRVQYQNFDSDITAMNQIAASHDDWDVTTLASTYVPEFVKDGMMLPIDKAYLEKYNVPDYISGVSPFVRDLLREMSGECDLNEYYVPTMMNSCGFLFDSSKYSRDDFSSWSALSDPRFKGKILLNNDPLDVYYLALADIHHEELQSGALTLKDLYAEVKDEYIREVKEWGRRTGPQIAGWDTGFSTEYMVQGKASIKTCWLTDANYIIDLSAEEGGPELDFVIPDEGSYICCDGLLIPKYCGNPEAAVLWIDYLLSPQALIDDLGEGWSNLTVADTVVLNAIQDREKYTRPVDLSYLFPDCPEKASEVYVSNALYVDARTIGSLSLCGDFSKRLEDLVLLFSQVQSQKLRLKEFWPELLLCLALLALLAAKLFHKSE